MLDRDTSYFTQIELSELGIRAIAYACDTTNNTLTYMHQRHIYYIQRDMHMIL